METNERSSKFYDVLPILLCGLSIPLSIFLWMGNLAFTFLTTNPAYQDGECRSDKQNVNYCNCLITMTRVFVKLYGCHPKCSLKIRYEYQSIESNIFF